MNNVEIRALIEELAMKLEAIGENVGGRHVVTCRLCRGWRLRSPERWKSAYQMIRRELTKEEYSHFVANGWVDLYSKINPRFRYTVHLHAKAPNVDDNQPCLNMRSSFYVSPLRPGNRFQLTPAEITAYWIWYIKHSEQTIWGAKGRRLSVRTRVPLR